VFSLWTESDKKYGGLSLSSEAVGQVLSITGNISFGTFTSLASAMYVLTIMSNLSGYELFFLVEVVRK
jgi:hypothetical protein